jgi:hypothetical protein
VERDERRRGCGADGDAAQPVEEQRQAPSSATTIKETASSSFFLESIGRSRSYCGRLLPSYSSTYYGGRRVRVRVRADGRQ